MSCSLVSPTVTFNACSAFKTLLFVWSQTRPGLLRDHHWLPINQRIEYKLCMTVHRCLHDEPLHYLADLITHLRQRPSKQASDLPRLVLSQCHILRHHLGTSRSLWLSRMLGKICHHHFVGFIPLILSDANISLLRLFLFSTVRRPCCIRAHTSP